MNLDWPVQHFEQIAEAPDAVCHIWRVYVEYYDRVGPIPQMVSGQSQDTLPELSVCIAQMPSAQLATFFPQKKRLMEWADAAVQNKSGGR